MVILIEGEDLCDWLQQLQLAFILLVSFETFCKYKRRQGYKLAKQNAWGEDG